MEQTNNSIITNLKTFDAESKVKFGFIKPLSEQLGGKKIEICDKQSSQSSNGLMFQLPVMHTWGISDYDNNGKYKISLSLPSSVNDPQSKYADFKKALNEIEDKVLNFAFEKQIDVFGKKLDPKVYKDLRSMKSLFESSLKYQKNKETKKIDTSKPPIFSVGVPCYNKKWGDFSIYDINKNKLFPNNDNKKDETAIEYEDEEAIDSTPITLIPQRSLVIALVKPSHLYCLNGKIGIKWILIEVVVKPALNSASICDVNFDYPEFNDEEYSVVKNDEEKEPIPEEKEPIPEEKKPEPEEKEPEPEEKEPEPEEKEPEPVIEPKKTSKSKTTKK
jgi:hypothetical protein